MPEPAPSTNAATWVTPGGGVTFVGAAVRGLDSDNLAVDAEIDLAVNSIEDLAIAAPVTWTGVSAALDVVVLGADP